MAVDAVLAGDGVADGDADTVGKGFLLAGPGGFVGQFQLHFHGKMQRLARAREDRDEPVTGGVHDGAAIVAHQIADESQRACKADHRSRLVTVHEAGVTMNVGIEYRRQFVIKPFLEDAGHRVVATFL